MSPSRLERLDSRNVTFHFDNAVKRDKKDAVTRGLEYRFQKQGSIRTDVVIIYFFLQPRCGRSLRLDDGKGGDLRYNPKARRLQGI